MLNRLKKRKRLTKTSETTRIETLSDGVFAIALTLLVLELRVPIIEVSNFDHINYMESVKKLAVGLWNLKGIFIAWWLSFRLIERFWLHHHALLKYCRKADYSLILRNNSLLAAITLMPFATGLFGHYLLNPLALSIYGLTLSLNTFLLINLYKYVRKTNESINLPEGAFKSLRFYLLGSVFGWADWYIGLILFSIAGWSFRPFALYPEENDDKIIRDKEDIVLAQKISKICRISFAVLLLLTGSLSLIWVVYNSLSGKPEFPYRGIAISGLFIFYGVKLIFFHKKPFFGFIHNYRVNYAAKDL